MPSGPRRLRSEQSEGRVVAARRAARARLGISAENTQSPIPLRGQARNHGKHAVAESGTTSVENTKLKEKFVVLLTACPHAGVA